MIEDWIQPQHLDKLAINKFQNLFTNDDLPALRISNFLKSNVAQGLFEFCTHDANWTEKSFSLRKQAKVTEEVWNQAPEKDRFYSMLNLNPKNIARRGAGLDIFKMLMSDLRKDESVASWFAAISGLPIKKGATVSAKAYGPNDFLGPHNDRTSDRRLAFIFYLSKDWQPEFGGGLHMRGKNDKKFFFEYEYNSLIIFDVHLDQMHWIDPVSVDCGDKLRFSIGGWFDELKNNE